MSIRIAKLSLCAMVVGLAVLFSSTASAQGRDGQAPTLVNYGLEGFAVGAGLGLSIAQLSGTTHDGRLRTAITITGVGGLAGMGGGISLGLLDASRRLGGPTSGYRIIRWAEGGLLLGGVAGAATGALFWINDGSPRNLFDGAAVGALAGTVLGVVYASVTNRRVSSQRSDGLRIAFHTFATANETRAPGLMAFGSF